MRDYSLAHLSDSVLLHELSALVASDRLTTAELLAHIAEVDARKLYVPAGYQSMHAYCTEELRLSEDAAGRRIQAARAARRFPGLFSALAEGRLHLTAVCLLAPHLTSDSLEDLIEMATHQRKAEIEVRLARRFPAPQPRTIVRAIPAPIPPLGHALAHVERERLALDAPNEHALAHVHVREPELVSERYLVQVTISKTTHDKLRYAQELLSHAVRGGDVAQVLDRALDSLITQLEKEKFGATKRPQSRVRASKRARHIPVHVRRAVWQRDGGRCTFVGPSGRRCLAKKFLEFDHVEPVARGGKATVAGMRLRCRAHNQYEAEREFGADFMNRKRESARARAEENRVREAEARKAAQERMRDVVAGLRSLGCRNHEAQRAAEFSESMPGAPLEQRMRTALQFLSRRSMPRASRTAVTSARNESP